MILCLKHVIYHISCIIKLRSSVVSGLDTEMASVDIEFWSRVWDEGILRYPSYKRFMTASNSCCWKVKNVNLRKNSFCCFKFMGIDKYVCSEILLKTFTLILSLCIFVTSYITLNLNSLKSSASCANESSNCLYFLISSNAASFEDVNVLRVPPFSKLKLQIALDSANTCASEFRSLIGRNGNLNLTNLSVSSNLMEESNSRRNFLLNSMPFS
ncbi:hypothetical protein AWRI1631_73720 [Saccharomyces cerevisiae AWRI1631]|uniref:Uncharacterized protein n=1 Tax=Saccharomyces cerevisiae (strain AWRI1631) TaxID=545124 RepID=B5VJ94_YEAS6|nr:hypothetical protein AWRI1631_73720 [Saccharomyces cerevisiae AWRI1631]